MRAIWAAMALIMLVGAILAVFRGDWIYAVSGFALFWTFAIFTRAAGAWGKPKSIREDENR